MSIKTDLNKLQVDDTYSLLLFALYKLTGNGDYAALSQLAYLLDRDSLLKLCSFYGGTTITIPTVEELEDMFESLLLFYRVRFEGADIQNVRPIDYGDVERGNKILDGYDVIQKLLQDYKFDIGG